MKCQIALLALSICASYALNLEKLVGEPDCKFTSVEARWRKSCNWCRCTESGLGICTKRGCNPTLEKRLQGSMCEGDAEWKDDCNWCKCDAGKAVCETNTCDGKSTEGNSKRIAKQVDIGTRDVACRYKSETDRWRVSCNWCRCTETGLEICTRRGCPPALEVRLQDEKECEGEAEWKRDCNWCTCVEGRAICTATQCDASPQVPKLEIVFQTDKLGKVETPEEECFSESEDGSWRDECNWCKCSLGRATCTKKRCRPNYKERAKDTDECVGTIKWKKDCNWCECVEGKAVCSQEPCTTADSSPAVELERTCKADSEGGQFKQECNWCSCRDGLAVCTKKKCFSERKAVNALECKGEVTWKVGDCNWCRCVDGQGLCTTNSCERSEACIDGQRWFDGCNTCTCYKGKGLCTLRACIQGNSNISDSQPNVLSTRAEELTNLVLEGGLEHSCKPGSRWLKDCNWCSCIDGVPTCTKKGCLPDAARKIKGNKCEEGSQWQEECNTCICADGIQVCTKQFCLSPSHKTGKDGSSRRRSPSGKELPLDVKCLEGSRWREDCNWCNCNKGLGVCTKKGCIAGVNVDQPECKPDSEWEGKDCTWCHCDGEKAVCEDAPERCSSEFGENLRKETAFRRGVDCVNGSVWREACNWCTCTSGVGACTAMGCSSNYHSDEPECEGDAEWKGRNCTWCVCVNRTADCFSAPEVCEEGDKNASPKLMSQEISKRGECTEGSRWRKDCNWCTCSNGIGACTIKACLPRLNKDEPECEGNSEWLISSDCTWCTCKDGKADCAPAPDKCSNAPSIGGVAAQPFTARKDNEVGSSCTEGSRWMKLCNWCTCSNGVGFCEQKACITDEAKALHGTCEGNSRWKDDCNWCDCVDGRGVCTEMGCLTSADDSSNLNTPPLHNENVTCTEGSRWGVDCNWCTCSNGIGVCTSKGCLPGHEKVNEGKCDGKSKWKKDCNWCHCIEGKSVCTQKACQTDGHSPLPAADEQVCNAGDSWVEECNICLCVNNIVVCTKRACEDRKSSRGGAKCLRKEEFKQDCNTCVCINGEKACTKKKCLSESSPEEGKLPELCKQGAVDPDAKVCGGFQTKWTYSVDDGKCELVVYGGCGGTDNLFSTSEECEQVCGSHAPKLRTDPECRREYCNWKRYAHYIAKNCNPVYEGGSCCPTSFSCQTEIEQGMNPNLCYYKGKEYKVGDKVPVEDVCSVNCICTDIGRGNIAHINCANVECPSLFQPRDPGCRLLYTPGECCETGKDCRSEGNSDVEQRAVKCHWKNTTWEVGSKMYFDDQPCQKCVCTADFTDPQGPGCEKVNCGYDFRYRSKFEEGCTPIYFEEKCCSVDWMCPGDNRLTTDPQQPQIPEGSETCSIGDVKVPVGSSLSVSDCHIKCRCQTPPDLTCVRYRSCELAEENVRAIVDSSVCPQVKCSSECTTIQNLVTGCPECYCPNLTFTCPEPTCPPLCQNPRKEFDEESGCYTCKCECRKDFQGKPPCPMDCIVKVFYDKDTGCDKCVCDRS